MTPTSFRRVSQISYRWYERPKLTSTVIRYSFVSRLVNSIRLSEGSSAIDISLVTCVAISITFNSFYWVQNIKNTSSISTSSLLSLSIVDMGLDFPSLGSIVYRTNKKPRQLIWLIWIHHDVGHIEDRRRDQGLSLGLLLLHLHEFVHVFAKRCIQVVLHESPPPQIPSDWPQFHCNSHYWYTG